MAEKSKMAAKMTIFRIFFLVLQLQMDETPTQTTNGVYNIILVFEYLRYPL